MPTINVDQLAAYALVSPLAVSTYSVSYKQAIADAIKGTHNVTLQLVDFDLGTPVAKTVERFNTEIQLSVKPSSGFSGSMALAYTRMPIDNIGNGRDLDSFKYAQGANTTRDMLGVFNNKYGTKIDLTEIVDEPLNQTGDTIFKAASTAVLFLPGSQLNMGVLVPSDRDWELVGLLWPDTKAMYPTYTSGLDFTSIRATLNAFSTTQFTLTTAQANALIAAANSLGNYTLFAQGALTSAQGGLSGARAILVDLPNAAYPQCDQTGRFDRAVVVTPPSAGLWFTEPFLFQYNR